MNPAPLIKAHLGSLTGTIADHRRALVPALPLLLSAAWWPAAAAAQGEGDATTVELPFTTHDGFDMLGKLTRPAGPGPHPIVIYVQTAEGMTIDMRRPDGRGGTFDYFNLYADRLPPLGVAFFRYQGRGIRMGDAPPRYETIDRDVYDTSTLENKVRDVMAAVALVREQSDIDASRIILMGTSEGTLLAAEAASRLDGLVHGLVLYAVMPANMREVFRYILTGGSFLTIRRAFDANDDSVITPKEYEDDPRGFRARLMSDAPLNALDRNGDSLVTVDDMEMMNWTLVNAVDTERFEVLDAWVRRSAGVSTPANWFRDHFAHDPIWTFLAALDVPVGLFHGDADVYTPVSGVRRLEERAREAGKANLRFHYFEDHDHALNLGRYFGGGELPAGHRAIFTFIVELAG